MARPGGGFLCFWGAFLGKTSQAETSPWSKNDHAGGQHLLPGLIHLRMTKLMKTLAKANTGKSGFSLVELTIVVVILGVLAMMGVPRYQKVVERAKAVEAFTYLAHIEGAQERHNARTGSYARYLGQLDISGPAPKHFRVGGFTSYNWETQW